MIRQRRLPSDLLDAWLVDQRLTSRHQRYRLRLWRDCPTSLPALRTELRAYLDEALDDARTRLRAGFADDLSPFSDPATDPAANFPALLHRTTLLGYFGETLAGMAIEHWGGFGHSDWQVPAFLFRFHYTEFQHLEQINQRLRDGEVFDPDVDAELRPGRTGDDALAFRRAADGRITDILTLEAKCLARNRNATIDAAHAKLSAAGPLPSGIRELIELLTDYDHADAQAWQQSLVAFRLGGYRSAARHDAVAYATGHIPAKGDRQAWLPDAPHTAYSAKRRLEAMEFQFANLDELIDLLYRGA
jgi:hypothetical protein